MYARLGQAVVRYAAPMAVGWLLLLLALMVFAPAWRAVTQDGEFAFLPADSRTKLAAEVYRQAFLVNEGKLSPANGTVPTGNAGEQSDGEDSASDLPPRRRGGLNPLDSNIVIVVHRKDQMRPQDGMADADYQFIERHLVPRLQKIAETTGRGYEALTTEELAAPRPVLPKAERVVVEILTRPPSRPPNVPELEDVVGALLQSEDDRASLVYVQLNSEMLDRSNNLLISEVERRIINDPELLGEKPFGLALDLSGTAVVGRDVLRAEQDSASRTEHLTQWLVIVLLLLIYRAPLLALIPLVTVGLAVHMTQRLLALLAGWGWIGVFTGLEVYVTVVVYGAGVDYCLFLIARYREELDQGQSFQDAIHSSLARVGAALATSAGTSIFGIGMMAFADFGKFRQAGIAISLGLTVVLCLALTFTPALLKLSGRWAFWPDLRRERLEAGTGWLPTLSLSRFLHEQQWLERGWQRVADLLLARPATVFVSTLAALLPLALVGWLFQGQLNYGLLTDLPQSAPSVLGAGAVQEHFPPGVSGETALLLQHPEFDLERLSQGIAISREIVAALQPQMSTLGLADIRCHAHPLGLTETARRMNDKYFRRPVARRMLVNRSKHIFGSTAGPLAGQVMRLDLIFSQDPFLRESIEQLAQIEAAVLAAVPPQFRDAVQLHSLGPTASLRDLKLTTDGDRILIDVLVVIVVYLLLIALLRQPAICTYLLVTVVFSFLVTMGATYLVFRLHQGAAFAGLDWKIPLFLFTILIAIGEDYNILLMARVTEEQERHGLIGGVMVALTKTGSIISSCGVIMAGTFASLMTGTLLGMVEMGFALAFGVLLDTFVVRPILVPTYLILLYSGRFGALGRWLGAPVTSEPEASPFAAVVVAPVKMATSQHGELAEK